MTEPSEFTARSDHFTPEQQLAFDRLIGQAAMAREEQKPKQALEALDQAKTLLEQHQITDAYDWSGWYELRMLSWLDVNDEAKAGEAAAEMLKRIDPTPTEFTPEHHVIIQDSLVEASLVLARYLSKQAGGEQYHQILRSVLENGMRYAEHTQLDEALKEMQALYRSL